MKTFTILGWACDGELLCDDCGSDGPDASPYFAGDAEAGQTCGACGSVLTDDFEWEAPETTVLGPDGHHYATQKD